MEKFEKEIHGMRAAVLFCVLKGFCLAKFVASRVCRFTALSWHIFRRSVRVVVYDPISGFIFADKIKLEPSRGGLTYFHCRDHCSRFVSAKLF